jgi:hypothetical protein
MSKEGKEDLTQRTLRPNRRTAALQTLAQFRSPRENIACLNLSSTIGTKGYA